MSLKTKDRRGKLAGEAGMCMKIKYLSAKSRNVGEKKGGYGWLVATVRRQVAKSRRAFRPLAICRPRTQGVQQQGHFLVARKPPDAGHSRAAMAGGIELRCGLTWTPALRQAQGKLYAGVTMPAILISMGGPPAHGALRTLGFLAVPCQSD